MADGEQIEETPVVNGLPGKHGPQSEEEMEQQQNLAEDKEKIDPKKDWQEIKVGDVPTAPPEQPPDRHGSMPRESEDSKRSERDGMTGENEPQDIAQTPTSPAPPVPPEKVTSESTPPTPGRQSIGALPSMRAVNGTAPHDRERSDSQSTQATVASRKSTVPLSSIVFVVSALEQISASKDARRKKELGDAAQKALGAIKQKDGSATPEVIFEPLRLATETSSIPLTTTALDCIGKLISYSYFSIPAQQDPSLPPSQQQLPLIDRAIETICDCFQDEATPIEIQLQIVKSLLAAVLNDKLVVHGSGLLKAVRQVYNIFLLSKSGPNQQVAQGTLTQMVGTVFERVTNRMAMKEARLNLSKIESERGTANASTADLNGSTPALESVDGEATLEGDGSSEGNSILTSDQPMPREPGKPLTLQDIEKEARGFDDRIGDNAPTMVTPAKSALNPARTASGQTMSNGEHGEHGDDGIDEEEEDEIFVKDAFLVFRSMCRLSTKELPPDQQQDIKSQNMRSKLVSLAIIRTTLNNNMAVFTSPLCTIRGSANNEPASFGQAVNQYLRLSVSRNAASSVKQVFEMCTETFWLMLKDMRVMLKVMINFVHLLQSRD